MKSFRLSVGDDKDLILDNAFDWVENEGKQVYQFPDTANDSNKLKCQLCGKTCYPAEKVTYNKIPYHKDCFRCLDCSKKLNPSDASPISNANFSCSNHYNNILLRGKKTKIVVTDDTPKPSKKSIDSTEPVDLSEGIEWRSEGKKQIYKFPEDLTGDKKRVDPRCQKCGLTVYPAEKFTYEKIPYHRKCVRCLECHKTIGQADAVPFGPDVFLCQNHYSKVFGQIRSRSRSRSASPSGSFATTDDLTEGLEWKRSGKKQEYKFPEDARALNPRCNFCGKKSYSAETITYNNIPYHNFCFRCKRCGKKLCQADANPFGDDVYLCNNHFNNVVMMLGADISRGPVDSSGSVPKQELDEYGLDKRMYSGYEWRVNKGKQTYKFPEDLRAVNPRCQSCGKKAYPAEIFTYEKVPFHKKCFRCLKCNKKLTPANATPFGEDVFLCDPHFGIYGQGGGLPTKGQTPVQTPSDETEQVTENLEKLSMKERRKRRKAKEAAMKN